jgi:hypothetical protein
MAGSHHAAASESVSPVATPSRSLAPLAARQAAAAALRQCDDYYRTQFAHGEAVRGTPAGVQWWTTVHLDSDVAPQLKAFSDADKNFTAADEPPSMSDWRYDIGAVSGDVGLWYQTGASFDTGSATAAQLHAAAQKVLSDLDAADQDTANVLAGK